MLSIGEMEVLREQAAKAGRSMSETVLEPWREMISVHPIYRDQVRVEGGEDLEIDTEVEATDVKVIPEISGDKQICPKCKREAPAGEVRPFKLHFPICGRFQMPATWAKEQRARR